MIQGKTSNLNIFPDFNSGNWLFRMKSLKQVVNNLKLSYDSEGWNSAKVIFTVFYCGAGESCVPSPTLQRSLTRPAYSVSHKGG